MCGIIAYTGSRQAAPILMAGLRDLEYRGYDSAGVALLPESGGEPAIAKRRGKIAELDAAIGAEPLPPARTGIGHTRWATHGAPSDANAHPHTGSGNDVVVVHNGIVENYAALRAELLERGHAFESETDSETIAHLLEETLNGGRDLLAAMRETCARLAGSQAIVALTSREPGVAVGARIGNAGAVVVGYGEGEMLLSSDLAALLPHTRDVAFLADRQLVRIDEQGATYATLDGSAAAVEPRTVSLDPESALKGEYDTYMLKEVMEQPAALADTIGGLMTVEPARLSLDDLAEARPWLERVERVLLVGMGTSLHAAMVGRWYFEQIARLPADIDNASEFRYREPVLGPETLVISVSQSGETVDVLEAMTVARARGAPQITICNTPGSQTTRVADGTVHTYAGLERGVASTKTFTTSIAALFALALETARARGRLSDDDLARHVRDLAAMPEIVGRQLDAFDRIARAADRFRTTEHILFLGRGPALPIALEGALKMKELSYVHAEGYAAGEMKHGPIALIDPEFPTVALAGEHALRSKIVSNIEQIRARDGEVLALVTEGDEELIALANEALTVPSVPALLEPLAAIVPLQVLAYATADARGCDIDQPRNLAKTVTVE
ncbi:MAG: glutamine--fructose-6-phosphate transaminase (isomerizing) [Dehalococcoidia bacterium]|nr:glutamine--fructose-6-phosphate transaminase (isomerizing) [Dehalococcoidia bacterium]MYA53890.1 glutamine--fructose-6-phosphate transaminase (isomerizing) [Dehalococcoidia bacterium]